jgi:hypothetical protein
MKLGAEVLAKLKGTSLDRAREIDELIMLNRGAEPGELTPIVAKLVEAAAAGETVSAIAVGAEFSNRKKPEKACRDRSQQRAAR